MNSNRKIEYISPDKLEVGDVILITPACYDDCMPAEYTVAEIVDCGNWYTVKTQCDTNWAIPKDDVIERIVK